MDLCLSNYKKTRLCPDTKNTIQVNHHILFRCIYLNVLSLSIHNLQLTLYTKLHQAPPSRYIIAINMTHKICASKISQLPLHQDILFPLTQLFICGNSQYRFPKCHTHRAFKLPLCTYEATNFSHGEICISSPPNTKVHSSSFLKNSVWVTSGKSCQAAIMRLIQEQLAHATLHSARDSTINL